MVFVLGPPGAGKGKIIVVWFFPEKNILWKNCCSKLFLLFQSPIIFNLNYWIKIFLIRPGKFDFY